MRLLCYHCGGELRSSPRLVDGVELCSTCAAKFGGEAP